MKTPHKHAELIKAWADGAQIQWYDTYGKKHVWKDCGESFDWSAPVEFRIKPPEDIVAYGRVRWDGYGCNPRVDSLGGIQGTLDNIKLVFDGQTFQIKHAEVI